MAARRGPGRLVGPLLDRRAGRGRLRRRPGDRRISARPRPPISSSASRDVPELTARYRSVEFAFHKRFSHNWQLFGSLAWNRATGTTTDGLPLERRQLPGPADPERLHQHLRDRRPPPGPAIRRPPGGDGPLRRGLFRERPPQGPERHALGPHGDDHPADGLGRGPRGHRDARHRLPGEPGLATVRLVEDPGPEDREGVRQAGRVPFAVSVDVFNLLGDKYRTLDLNDGGTWAPDGEGASAGTRVVSRAYNVFTPLWGTRVVRFNLNLRF
ncbi:MAG: hypothetical protein MZV63_64930 [Marinilabiliales bacterium]|nr:hypothetical protein [Marinilabiliales bacterium]